MYIMWRARSKEYIRGVSIAKTGVSVANLGVSVDLTLIASRSALQALALGHFLCSFLAVLAFL